jgi:carboxypeptidase Taq
MSAPDAYQWLVDHSRETAYLVSIERLLSWDQRTQLPPKGHAHRHEQLAVLAGLVHARRTDPRLGEKLTLVAASDLVQDPEGVAAVNVREWRRDYERAVKIPPELAVALARAAAAGETAWEAARPANDWEAFKPYLEHNVALQREKAGALGYELEPYDALLDGYEPGETAAGLIPIFASLKEGLGRLIGKLQGSPRRPDPTILAGPFPRAAQERFARAVAGRLGYDLAAGRLDATAHPFTAGIGLGDVRITTRYDDHNFAQAFFSTLHEAGHALYYQGLPPEHWGTPRGRSISLGIHESQSRLLENLVGRSLGFWQHFYPQARELFSALRGLDLEAFYGAVNEVRPDLIRTEADEVTYNLHILLRFDLERALVLDDLRVADLPGAWNGKMQEYLGLVPPDHARGVMQDVHWSGGHFGYFPTYTLGNLYAAQFFARAAADVGDLAGKFARGSFGPLTDWLRQKVHSQGSRFRPRPLVLAVTGEDLNPRYLLDYLEKKFLPLYGLG